MEDTNNTNNQNPANQEGNNTNNQATNNNDLFEKLDSAMEKRLDGLAKSMLKDNGVSDDELKEVISQYNAHKKSKADMTSGELKKLQKENEALKSEKIQTVINNAAFSKALDLGVDKSKVPYLLKLADLSKVTNEKGEVNEDAIKSSLEAVIKDIPELKTTNSNGGGFKVGADGKNKDTEDTDKKLRQAFGL